MGKQIIEMFVPHVSFNHTGVSCWKFARTHIDQIVSEMPIKICFRLARRRADFSKEELHTPYMLYNTVPVQQAIFFDNDEDAWARTQHLPTRKGSNLKTDFARRGSKKKCAKKIAKRVFRKIKCILYAPHSLPFPLTL